MKKVYLVILVLFFNLFVWVFTGEGKTKKEVISESKENKIDYGKIEWRTREELKANLVKDFTSTPSRTTGVFESTPDYPITASSPFFDIAGYTYYDYASNERLPRQIALSVLGHVHVDWTKGYDSTSSGAGKREIAYSSWFNASTPKATAEKQVSANGARGGFSSIAVLPDGRGVCVYHHNATIGANKPGTYVSIETTATAGNFSGELHAPDSVAGMCDASFWPSCAAQKVTPGDTAVVHIISVEGIGACGNQDFVYTRARESSPGVFTFSSAQRPDSGDFISPIVVASRKSNKVAIVYVREKVYSGDYLDADVFYIESTNGGRDWVNGFRNDARDTAVIITYYQSFDPVRAAGDLSAVYDEDDSLHIVWVAPLYNGGLTASECYIYHWSKPTGIDQVADGTYLITDASLPNSVAKNNLRNPHIGVHDGTANLSHKNYLYVTWSQFGPSLADTSDDGILNGDIYVNASTNGGNSWGNPINITNSFTPGCDRNCDSDVYPSLAESINDTLHVSYINDREAGRFDQGDGEVLSPVLYYKFPAYQPSQAVLISVTPPIFEDSVVTPVSIIDTFFRILNVGNQTLRIDSVREAIGSSWLTILTSSFPDSIPEGGAPKNVYVRFDGTGLPTSTYSDTVIVYNNSSNKPRLAIPIHFTVVGTLCTPGDFNGNNIIDVIDIALLGTYLINCGSAPNCLPNEANGNCELDYGDVIYDVNRLFKGGPAPLPYCSNPDSFVDPGYPDTIIIGTAGGCPGDTVNVPVYINNDELISMMVPLRIDTNKVVCDSVITAGTRGSGKIIGVLKYCKDQRGILLYSNPNSTLLSPGSGIVAYLRCRIKNGAPSELVKIDSTFLDPNKLRFFKTNTYSIKPVFVSGGVYICKPTHVVFRAFSPIDLVVTEPPAPPAPIPGLDSIGLVFNTIQEGSSYDTTLDVSVPPDAEKDIVITIPIPHPGTYNIRVVPHDTGHFVIDFRQGSNSRTVIAGGIITNTDTSITYTVEVLPASRGDVNKSGGNGDIVDIVFLVNYVFKGGPAPDPKPLGDVDCGGIPRIGLADIVYLVNFVFRHGPAPCS